ncbi:MAG: hypothetical protein K2P34_04620 [Lachnospiraceae bacterium]|nr:hypothetical protein [Lachnospiraceae bacterium]
MKTAKLVIGILSIVLCVFVTFQSCAAGLGNALADNGEVSGSAGAMVAVCLLTAGIVSIATRNKEKNGGNIACIILYMIGALMGGSLAGSYADLKIWGGYAGICGIIHLMSAIKCKNNGKKNK